MQQTSNSRKSTHAQQQPSTPSITSRDPKQRAEERMLQLAILESAKVSAPALSPVKNQRELEPGAYFAANATAIGNDNPVTLF